MTAPRPSPVKIVLAFAAVYTLWGSTYLAIRLAIDTLPPFLMTGTRFTLAGLILCTWAVVKGERFIPPLHLWRRSLVIGGLVGEIRRHGFSGFAGLDRAFVGSDTQLGNKSPASELESITRRADRARR